MDAPRVRRLLTPRRWAPLVAIGACVSLLVLQLPANALEVTKIYTPVTGNGTWFDGLGSPYGGCGLPQDVLESQSFVALNVYNTPKDYAMYTRPMAEGDSKIGLWNNGHNCGRWVEVELSDFCTGTNDGAVNSTFCRGGSWVSDKYNGAKLTLVVADSCGDPNGWCRDDPYHLDFSKSSLSKFVMSDGSLTSKMLDDNKWNNRHITWKFVDPPNYKGDIQIGFLQGAQVWWTAIAVSNLPHGIHGIEYFQDGAWKKGKLNGDMGQSYIISGLKEGARDFKIRVLDVDDKYVNNGRMYSFSLPSSCENQCSGAYTKTTYTTDGGSVGPSVGPSDPSDPSSPSDPSGSSSSKSSSSSSSSRRSTSSSSSRRSTSSSSSRRSTSSSRRSSSGSSRSTGSVLSDSAGCTATYQEGDSWSDGFQGQVTVTAGDAAVDGWTVAWRLADGQTIDQSWGGVTALDESTVTVANVAWNGALAANASTTFGFIGTGSGALPDLTCTAS